MMIVRKLLLGFVWLVMFIFIIIVELCIIPDNCSRWASNHLGIFMDIIFIGCPAVLATVACNYIRPYILKKTKTDKK